MDKEEFLLANSLSFCKKALVGSASSSSEQRKRPDSVREINPKLFYL